MCVIDATGQRAWQVIQNMQNNRDFPSAIIFYPSNRNQRPSNIYIYKNPPRGFFREGSCAPDGNRTRTDIAVHGIFLLLLLLHKPASSVMLSRCSLDYFLTMRRIAFRPSLYSLYAIYQPKLNLVSRRQSLHFCKRGFRLLGEFYSQGFP